MAERHKGLAPGDDDQPQGRARRRRRAARQVPHEPNVPPRAKPSRAERAERAARAEQPERGGEHALRGLVSTRGTDLPADIAMRAREFALPTDEELRQAEEELVLVRKNYVPPEPLARRQR